MKIILILCALFLSNSFFASDLDIVPLEIQDHIFSYLPLSCQSKVQLINTQYCGFDFSFKKNKKYKNYREIMMYKKVVEKNLENFFYLKHNNYDHKFFSIFSDPAYVLSCFDFTINKFCENPDSFLIPFLFHTLIICQKVCQNNNSYAKTITHMLTDFRRKPIYSFPTFMKLENNITQESLLIMSDHEPSKKYICAYDKNQEIEQYWSKEKLTYDLKSLFIQYDGRCSYGNFNTTIHKILDNLPSSVENVCLIINNMWPIYLHGEKFTSVKKFYAGGVGTIILKGNFPALQIIAGNFIDTKDAILPPNVFTSAPELQFYYDDFHEETDQVNVTESQKQFLSKQQFNNKHFLWFNQPMDGNKFPILGITQNAFFISLIFPDDINIMDFFYNTDVDYYPAHLILYINFKSIINKNDAQSFIELLRKIGNLKNFSKLYSIHIISPSASGDKEKYKKLITDNIFNFIPSIQELFLKIKNITKIVPKGKKIVYLASNHKGVLNLDRKDKSTCKISTNLRNVKCIFILFGLSILSYFLYVIYKKYASKVL